MGFLKFLMKAIFKLLDYGSTGLLLVDTLGLIYQLRKAKETVDVKDYRRVCFTWILILFLGSLCCCKSSCKIGNFLGLIFTVARIAIILPITGVANKLYDILIEGGMVENNYQKVKRIVCAQLNKLKGKTSEISNIDAETIKEKIQEKVNEAKDKFEGVSTPIAED